MLAGLVPAAGRGKRLAPLPMPKELFPIGYQDYTIDGRVYKRPKVVSQYLIEHLVTAGAQKIIIVLGPEKHDIMHYFGSGSRFGVEIAYVYQEQPHGMPFGLDLAWSWLRDGDDVLFGMPDTIIEPADAFQSLHQARLATEADLMLGLFATDTPSKFGMVVLDGEQRVVETIDKPAETTLRYMWGNAAWNMTFGRFMHDYLIAHASWGCAARESVFGDVLNAAIRGGLSVRAHIFEGGRYIDIGTVEELDTALQLFHL